MAAHALIARMVIILLQTQTYQHRLELLIIQSYNPVIQSKCVNTYSKMQQSETTTKTVKQARSRNFFLPKNSKKTSWHNISLIDASIVAKE